MATGAIYSLSLGAALLIGCARTLLVSSLVPFWASEASPRRHDARRVREHAIAAEQAARASGLLFPRKR